MNESLPLVSICCITYNQEKYIRQCLDGFIMQKTDFEFEVIIHDDASTDSTAEIIREYEEKYPNIIKPIYQIENQYTKGKGILIPFVYPRAKAKYIALCEGDDYWIDPYKLQKQVDFLENNEEYSLCFHNVVRLYINGEKKVRKKKVCLKTSQIIKYGVSSIPTNSMVFRTKDILKLPLWFYNSPVGDYPLAIHLSMKGKFYYIDSALSVYRVLSKGSWSVKMSSLKMRLDYFNKKSRMLRVLNKDTNNKYVFSIIYSFLSLYLRHGYFILFKYPFSKITRE